MSIFLALLASGFWGSSDFIGGLVTKRIGALRAVFWRSFVGFIYTAILAAIFSSNANFYWSDVWWSVSAGVAVVFGSFAFYYGLSMGRMSVVAPASGLTGAAVPVVIGVVIGERPELLQWCGIALALVAIFCVSTTPDNGPNVGRSIWLLIALGGFAGATFGFYFFCTHKLHNDSGLLSLPIMIFTQTLIAAFIALFMRQKLAIAKADLRVAALPGVIEFSGTLMFLLANNIGGLLSIVGILGAMFPIVTVLLAHFILKEHLSTLHRIGLGITAGSLALIAAG